MNLSVRWPSRLLLFSLTNACHTGHAYYALIFASGRASGRRRHSHVFATFVRAWGEGPHQPAWSIEAHTISWLPQELPIDPTAPLPQPGINLDLHATLVHVLSQGERVWLWGPWAIDSLLYERAVRQERRLAGGTVLYRASDHGSPPSRVSNALHAVSDLAMEWPRLEVPRSALGQPAGEQLALHLRPWLLHPDEVHPWLEARLALQDYPLTRRSLLLPRSQRGRPAA